MGEITAWLAQASGGDAAALDRVFEALYPELRRLARVRAAAGERTLTPTVLVHEAYLRLLGTTELALNDRRHFLACAARAMRAIVIDHARRRSAAKRGGRGDDIALENIEFALGVGSDAELIALDGANADFLGDAAARDRFLARAAALYADLDPEVMARPGVRAYFAQFLALRGEHAAAIREAERALADAPRSKDAATVNMLQRNAALALARAGAKGRAIELLQAIQAAPTGGDPHGAKLHDDIPLRLLLRDEPAYQALMREIEAGYEKL